MASAPQFASAAEIARNFGMWQDKAAAAPVIVTSHGRPRVAMLAFADYERLSREATREKDACEDTAQVAILLDHIAEAFVTFDTQLNVRTINSVARAYWAVSDRDLIGQGLVHAFPMLDDGMIADQLRRVLLSHEEASFDAPSHLYPDRLLRFRAFPFPGGVAMLFSDVADQIDGEREAARRISLRAAGDAHGEVGVAILTVRGSLTQVGRPFATIAGATVARLLGMTLAEMFPIERRDAIAAALDAVLEGAGPSAFDDHLIVGGKERRIRVALAEIREGFAVSGATVLLTALR